MAIVNTVLFNGQRELVVRCVKTDGGAEADTVVVDKSTFVGPNGLEPSELIVEKIEWSAASIATVSGVLLEWNLTADEAIAVLAEGYGQFDFRSFGGVSPQSGGDTGDIVVTNAAAATSGYTIILWLRKKD
ncbi:MAG: hypothetical protein ACREXG_02535 [Polaromonas sp.]